MLMGFQRERFLLRAIAGLFAVQFLIFLIGLAACIEQSRRSTGPVLLRWFCSMQAARPTRKIRNCTAKIAAMARSRKRSR